MIHHLVCASMRPVFGLHLVSRALLVERTDGLLLVDSGLGLADLADRGRLGRAWRTTLRPVLDPAGTAVGRIRELGLDPADVTDVVLTHLDLDTAGAVADLPGARVHLLATELAGAREPRGKEFGRYLPEQWTDARFVEHPTPTPGTDDWLGLPSVATVDADVRLVPLPGHSRGHAGVAVRDGDGWLLHLGDACFSLGELTAPPAKVRRQRLLARVLAHDDAARRTTLERLRTLVAEHGNELELICGHDPATWPRGTPAPGPAALSAGG